MYENLLHYHFYYITYAANYKKSFYYSGCGSDGKFVVFLFSYCCYQSQFFESFKKTLLWRFFLFFLSAIEVHPTMMTSAYEKPGNVKRVH